MASCGEEKGARVCAVGLRERKKRRIRQRIVEVARHLFEDHGYEATTLREIGARANITAGTILFHFKDKVGLLVATLEGLIDSDLAQAVKTFAAWFERPKALGEIGPDTVGINAVTAYLAYCHLSVVDFLINGPPNANRSLLLLETLVNQLVRGIGSQRQENPC